MTVSSTILSSLPSKISRQPSAPALVDLERGLDCRETASIAKSSVAGPSLQIVAPGAQQCVEPRVGAAGKAAAASTVCAVLLGVTGLGLLVTGLAVGLHDGKNRHHTERHQWVGGWIGGMAAPGLLLLITSLGLCATGAGLGIFAGKNKNNTVPANVSQTTVC